MGGIRFDALLGKVRFRDKVRELDADPASPTAEDAWVLKQGGGGGEGEPIGLLLALTYSSPAVALTYDLSYKTKEGDIVRASLAEV